MIERKNVLVQLNLNFIVDVPSHWTGEDVNFYLNESSWCASNVIDILQERDKRRCLCDITNLEYIRDANTEDERTWFGDSK